MMKYIRAILALCLGLCASFAYAQENIVATDAAAMPFLTIGPSPVSMSMGGVSSVVQPDAGAHFGNVAAIPLGERKFAAGASYTLWQPSGTHTSLVSAGSMWKTGRRVGLSFGVSSGISDAYDVMDENGISSGTFTPVDIRAGVGVSCLITSFLSAGVTLNYARSSLAEGESLNTFFADIQALFKIRDFRVSLSAANAGVPVKSVSGTASHLPVNVKAGAGYANAFGDHHVTAGLEAAFFCTGHTGLSAGAGAEYMFRDLVALRAGYHYGQAGVPSFASVGAGFGFAGIKVNAAYLIGTGESMMKNTFSVGLEYAF